ncbi:hypothetical protein BDD43_5043 [Mucilaginibacter gracilis]|uniref:Adhesin domain-containing protein n=1 Tax=Mucilaginibacter gracilis TaxID=423350 RepID=A0A495J723_9SPHI|nr:hypothetical protein [Mucilaginibacter gracilis]RKR84790.1 hypothetical protein BDD43_5043 [Mucilaginibacter gracilis]
MKTKFLIPLLAGYGLCLAQLSATAQDYKTHISKQFTLQKPAANTLVGIYNTFGSVTVEGYNGNNVLIEVDETISGNTNADVEQGKNEFKLKFEQNADTIMAYIIAPWYTKPSARGWHYDSDNVHYTVKLNFVVKVPNNVNLNASTVNNGSIDVKDVYGTLKTNNVNGPISIINAKGATAAYTVNGPITVNYVAVPNSESSYKTINGKLTITYPANLSADMQFKSMNGAFYTDFPEVEALPAVITKNQSKKDNATVYRLNKDVQVRVGKGGKLFKYETLNGNIYIKKQS